MYTPWHKVSANNLLSPEAKTLPTRSVGVPMGVSDPVPSWGLL